MSQDDRSYQKTFTPENTNTLITAIQTAVSNACDQYNPAIGCNATTFGTDVYNFGITELKRLATRFPQTFKYQQTGNLFRLFIDDYELAFHKVGYDVSEGIEHSFPNNDGVVSRIIFQQEAQMAFAGEGFDVKPTKKYILAHFASPNEGLSGVYLCSPSRKQNAVEWEVMFELWKTTGKENQAKPTAKTKRVPIEKIGELKLQPKEKINEIVLQPKVEKVRIQKDHE